MILIFELFFAKIVDYFMYLKKDITLLSGSLRKNSFNTKILRNFEAEILRYGYKCNFINLNDYNLPFYNEDIEKEGLPKNLPILKNIFQNSSGLIVSSPEYNGEISAVLKNTFDWLSRKLPGETFKQTFLGLKTIAVTSSTGKNGGTRALERLKVLLSRLGVDEDILSYSLGNTADEIFNENDDLLLESQITKIKHLVEYFIKSIQVNHELATEQKLKVS